MTDLSDLDDLGNKYERQTARCPNCNGTVREMRNSVEWLCDDCARYWNPGELNL